MQLAKEVEYIFFKIKSRHQEKKVFKNILDEKDFWVFKNTLETEYNKKIHTNHITIKNINTRIREERLATGVSSTICAVSFLTLMGLNSTLEVTSVIHPFITLTACLGSIGASILTFANILGLQKARKEKSRVSYNLIRNIENSKLQDVLKTIKAHRLIDDYPKKMYYDLGYIKPQIIKAEDIADSQETDNSTTKEDNSSQNNPNSSTMHQEKTN